MSSGPAAQASRHDARTLWAGVVAALLVVGATDYATGPELGFYVFYFFPIALAAWRLRRRDALAVAFAATLIWSLVDWYDGRVYTSDLHRLWNTLVRLASFVVFALALARARASLVRERELNAELSRALAEVHQLGGLLPICASCKRIRNDEGYWERVEKYISDRSEVDFTHSICPACEAVLYPEEGPLA